MYLCAFSILIFIPYCSRLGDDRKEVKEVESGHCFREKRFQQRLWKTCWNCW